MREYAPFLCIYGVQISVYRASCGGTVGRGLGPAGQFVKQIDIAAGDPMLFPSGKGEKCPIFQRREQAPALQFNGSTNGNLLSGNGLWAVPFLRIFS